MAYYLSFHTCDTQDVANPLVLSTECYNENVPFVDALGDQSLFIVDKLYPFHTFSGL